MFCTGRRSRSAFWRASCSRRSCTGGLGGLSGFELLASLTVATEPPPPPPLLNRTVEAVCRANPFVAGVTLPSLAAMRADVARWVPTGLELVAKDPSYGDKKDLNGNKICDGSC